MSEDWTQTIVIITSIIVPIIGAMAYFNRQANRRIDDLRDEVKQIREDIRLILNKLIPNRKD